ncbi:flavin-containing monooxygenase [Ketobacter alkanivorans]|uniref:FAD-containing monooxygenase EthA n=1 Tax=Ketobacter alkanivorans TaxID=1917421 RepID=A0A2K9LLK5_9GAMM|nr:NAD(P)/FAD-dependent oxidoreductase [Ketobacter alkanivorans]AUM11684.1 FAD-containing monooxygenase EthA [Ketobacter alkanivorans]
MTTEYVDVLIIGAGLSGVGAACHLQKKVPNKTYAILEGRQAIGGTWDLFRYPGIRSDSDMYTLGYNFKPWTNPKAIADGPDIRAYIQEAARENGIEKNIRFGHKSLKASWCTDKARWTVDVQRTDTGDVFQIECGFLLGCTGYYNYDAGFTPEFKGRDRFKGQIIHPQHWPENLDYSGKRVVVIGSGATAVTLIPSMAETAEHVVMLQRSPSYVASVPLKDKLSNKLRRYLPEKLVYRMARTRNVGFQMFFFKLARAKPKAIRRLLLSQVRRQVGENFDMKHFSPKYNPWDERLCAVPNGDLFKSIRNGKASVVTDLIDTFTEKGILLQSGQELEADIIITATGLDLQLLGGMALELDGQPFTMSQTMNYKGFMFKDVPNFGMVFGYTNASWTLKADITIEYLCRLLKLMDKKKMKQVTPRLTDSSVHEEPFLDFQSGYVQRALAHLPRQGNKAPWKLHQNYALDLAMLRYGDLDDGVITFSNPAA